MKYLGLLLAFASTTAVADDVLVTQKEKTFIAPNGGPAADGATELTIKKGQTVTFKNEDNVAHNVFSKGAKFNLKIQAPGEQKSFAFDEPGIHEVRCAIHPKMMLKVKVTP